MELPKLVYDDFYKFITSFSVLTFILSFYASYQHIVAKNRVLEATPKEVEFLEIYFYVFLFIAIISIIFFIWAMRKWKYNQNLHDRKLKAETIISEQTAQRIVTPEEQRFTNYSERGEIGKKWDMCEKSALVTYKIASVLPNSVAFNFLEDWKVWFWIANHETKKYRAYVKIKFITEDFEKDADAGYYGGTKAWNLNALSAIHAPGLLIPD